MNILLIEDDEADATLTERLLRVGGTIQGGAVTRVDRLELGLDKLKSEAFELILTDMGLPDSFGLDSVDRLVAQAPEVAIIVLTGNDDEELGVKSISHGAQDFLDKNTMEANALRRTIRYAVERKRRQTRDALQSSAVNSDLSEQG